MKTKYLLLLMALLLSTSLAAQTSGTCGANLTWSYSNQVLTISGEGEMDNYSSDWDTPWFWLSITRVDILDGVKSIGSCAFAMRSDVRSVYIPGSVISIGNAAFSSCVNLQSITCLAPQPPTMGTGVFACWNMMSPARCLYVLRNSRPLYVAADQWNQFYYVFGSDNTCGNNLVWTLQDSVLTITGIGDMYNFTHKDSVPWGPLYANAITSVVIQDGVTNIGPYAFEDCINLTSISIPNTVTRIGNYAFDNCISLASISLPDSLKSIGAYGFGGCSSLTSITIPEGIKYINAHVFHNCQALTSLIIPDSVTHIGDYAFADCVGLQSITLSQSLQRIGNYGLRGCTSLTSITIPESVTAIGNYCFDECLNLASIYLLNPVPFYLDQWGIGVFLAFSWEWVLNRPDFSIYVPCGALYLYEHSTGWNNYTNQLKYESHPDLVTYNLSLSVQDTAMGTIRTMDSTLATVCDTLFPPRYKIAGIPKDGYHFDHWTDGYAFNPRTVDLTRDSSFTVVFAKNRCSVKTVVNDSVRGYTSGDTTALYLDTVLIQAFANHGYHFVQWSDGVADNPRLVVLENTNLTLTANFEGNVQSINYQATNGIIQGPAIAFYSDVVTITAIPNEWYSFVQWSDGVTDNPRTVQITRDTTFTAEFIGQCGDSLYWSLLGDTIYFSGSGEMYSFLSGAPWMSQMNQLRQVVFAPDMTSISEGAFYRAGNLTTITIPDKVSHVGSTAFLQCSELSSVSFGTELQTIGDYAFAYCGKIHTMTSYNTTPPTVEQNVFRDVPRTAVLYVPSSALDAYKQHPVWGVFDVRPLDSAIDVITGQSPSHPQKIIKNNHFYILLPDGTRYTTTGQIIK